MVIEMETVLLALSGKTIELVRCIGDQMWKVRVQKAEERVLLWRAVGAKNKTTC